MTNQICLNLQKRIIGRYKDVIIYKNGRVEVIDFKDNLVVNVVGEFAAGLFIGDPDVQANLGNIHFAIGRGDPNWDTLPDKGKSNELPTVTQLYDEITRVSKDSVAYIDTWDGSVLDPGQKSNFIRIIFLLDDTIAIDEYIREFGLFFFGTSAADSGFMFDYVIHASYQKTSDIKQIIRTFEIMF